MRLDLHIHTTASDGSWSPEAVVRGARAGGLDVIAITDHDSLSAFRDAETLGRDLQLQVISGIELSSSHQRRDVHVLGYFCDPRSTALTEHEEKAARRRGERMREMLERLGEEGVDVRYERVEAAAGPDAAVLGRPHLARVLVDLGHAASVSDAFDRLIGDSCPSFVPTHLLTPVEAVRLILEAGGVPVWAHPPADLVDSLLPELLGAGLRGLEVYRPRSRPADVARLESLCRAHGLLRSGGSDWHSPDAGSALGDFYVTGEEVEALLSEGGM